MPQSCIVFRLMTRTPSVPLQASSSQLKRYRSSRSFTYCAGPLHSRPPAPLPRKMIQEKEYGVEYRCWEVRPGEYSHVSERPTSSSVNRWRRYRGGVMPCISITPNQVFREASLAMYGVPSQPCTPVVSAFAKP